MTDWPVPRPISYRPFQRAGRPAPARSMTPAGIMKSRALRGMTSTDTRKPRAPRGAFFNGNEKGPGRNRTPKDERGPGRNRVRKQDF